MEGKKKRTPWIALSALFLCLAFTLGYLLGLSQGETVVTITELEEPAATVEVRTTEIVPAEQTEANDPADEASFPLDLNTATQSELEQLPGIGSELAKRIVAYRENNGPFVTTEQLMDVSGIGEKRYADMEPLVTIGGEQ